MSTLPPRKVLTPNKVYKQNATPLELLLQLGFSKHRAEKALAATGNRSVQLAFDWLLAHISDSSLDEDWPREYVLYACPTGPLLLQLEEFWKQSKQSCGWNGAHSFTPHITLVSFFKAPDNYSLQLSKLLNQVVETVGPPTEGVFSLEPYISPNFMGLFVSEGHAEYLKKIAMQYVTLVSSAIGLTVDTYEQMDALATCFPWCAMPQERPEQSICLEPHVKSLHITLAYQFASNSYHVLKGLVDELHPLKPANWEFRLYSRDPRLSTSPEKVHAVKRAYTPQKNDEIELRLGDYMFIEESALRNSPDSWVLGTSWLTGVTGYLPTVYTERTSESDAWTLQVAIPLNAKSGEKIKANTPELEVDASRGSQTSKQSTPSSNNATLLNDSELGAAGTELAFKEWDQKMANYMNNKLECFLDPSEEEQGILNTSDEEIKINGKQTQHPQRTVYTIRHGERVDFTFGKWVPFCFDEADNYTRKDLNMPITLPKRAGGRNSFEYDSPLTMVGKHQARLTGEGAKNLPGKWTVFCSPSLRCVETATGFIEGLGLKGSLKIKIEPGLFEWIGWYPNKQPTFMTTAELLDAKFDIDSEYEPYNKLSEPPFTGFRIEPLDEFYERSGKLAMQIAMDIKEEGINILLVGHACTLDTTSRGLRELGARSAPSLSKVLRRIPYCSLSAMVGPPWRFINPPCPPMMSSSNARFDFKILQID